MSYLSDIADAVWIAGTRTLDAESPAASNSSFLDDIGYAVWTAGTRELDGGTTYDESGAFGAVAEIAGEANVELQGTGTFSTTSACDGTALVDLVGGGQFGAEAACDGDAVVIRTNPLTFDESGQFSALAGCDGDAEVHEDDLLLPLPTGGGVTIRRRPGTAIDRLRFETPQDDPPTHRIEQLWVLSKNRSSMSARLSGRCSLQASLGGSSKLNSRLLVLERPSPHELAELLSVLNFLEVVE